MFFIPWWLISILTFPGVIIHELAHKLFCDITKTPVFEVKYFQFWNPAGYVLHWETQGLKNSFLISIWPLIVNSIICMIMTMPFVFSVFILKESNINTVFMLMGWIGFSVGMHAFPSNHDIDNFVSEVKRTKNKGLLYVIAYVFSGIIRLANVLRIVWFDLIYAIGISYIIPTLFS